MTSMAFHGLRSGYRMDNKLNCKYDSPHFQYKHISNHYSLQSQRQGAGDVSTVQGPVGESGADGRRHRLGISRFRRRCRRTVGGGTRRTVTGTATDLPLPVRDHKNQLQARHRILLPRLRPCRYRGSARARDRQHPDAARGAEISIWTRQ